jgi:hypothetical protein
LFYFNKFLYISKIFQDKDCKKQVKIVDSTTISLFKGILSYVVRKSKDGKRKGGIKVHTVIIARGKVLSLVRLSPTTTHYHNFFEKLKCDDFYVFDKGYKAFRYFFDKESGFKKP